LSSADLQTLMPVVAGAFAAGIHGEIVAMPPVSGDLPGRQTLSEVGAEVGFRNGPMRGVDHADAFAPAAFLGNTQCQAIADGWMGGEGGFDGFRGNLPTRDIDEVGGATGDEKISVGQDPGEVG
jgi:hypothetical protein